MRLLGSGVWTALAVSAALVAYNTVMPMLGERFQRFGYLPTNLAAMAALLFWARRFGQLDATSLGLTRHGVLRSTLVGAAIGIAIVLPLIVVLQFPQALPTRIRSLDLPSPTLPGLLFQTLLRIPLGTALFEEVAFRGVLYGLLVAQTGRVRAALFSSAVFALWHIGPTIVRLRELYLPTTPALLASSWAATLLGTFIGGLLLVLLRERTRHLAGCITAHWLINALALVALFLRR